MPGRTPADPRARTPRRRTPGRAGRGRCGRSPDGSSRPRSRRAARRTSAGRRSAAPAARRTRRGRTAPAGAARRAPGRLQQQLAAHPEVAEQRVAVVERRARGTCRGAGPPRCAGRRGRRRSRRAARVAAYRARVQHLHGGDGAPRTCRARPARTTSTSGSSGTGGRAYSAEAARRTANISLLTSSAIAAAAGRRRRRRSRRTPSRRPLLGLLLGAADAVAVEPLADADLGGEGLHVVGALGLDEVLGDAEPAHGRQLLEGGLPVQAGAELGGRGHQRVEQQVHDRRRGVEPAAEVDRADHRLHRVGQDRGLRAAAGGLLAAAEHDVVAQADAPGRPRPARGR